MRSFRVRNTLGGLALVLLTLVIGLGVAAVPPAGAHTGDGAAGGSNFRSFFVDPGAACLEWTLYSDDDGHLGLSSRCPGVVIVLGYEDEPYLEFSASGVRENRLSPSAYLNADAKSATTVPDFTDPTAEPDWVPRSSLATYRWHDHRTHWMVATPPDAEASSARVIEWRLPLRFDDAGTGAFTYVVEAAGELWYDKPLPWTVLLTLTAVPVLGVTAFALRKRGPTATAGVGLRWPSLARGVSLLVGVATALTMVGVLDHLLAAGATTAGRLVDAGLGAVVLGGASWATWRGRRGDGTAFLALLGAALALAWAYGWPNRLLLSAARLRSPLPDLLVRVTVALPLVVVLSAGVALVAWQLTSRRASPPEPQRPRVALDSLSSA